MEIYKDNPNTNNNPWLAGRVLSTTAYTPGLKALVADLNTAFITKINDNIYSRVQQFNYLRLDDLALLIPQSYFTHHTLWIEWTTEHSFIDTINPQPPRNNEVPSLAQIGILIKTSADGRSGYASFISGAEEVFISPISLNFNWRSNFSLPDDVMDKLRDNLKTNESVFKDNGIFVENKTTDLLLEINSRFALERNIYVSIPKEAEASIEPILNASAALALENTIFLVGLANILECCDLTEWREAKLSIN